LKRFLHKGLQNIEILKAQERNPEDNLKPFRDRLSALEYLRPFGRDSLSMMSIRRILAENSFNGEFARLSDHQILELLADRLASGQFRILELPFEMPVWSPVEPEVEEEAAEPAAAVTLETAWIRFEVVHDVTGEPIPDVKLKIKMPDSTEKDSTTGNDGTIEFRGIDPGSCEFASNIKDAKLENTLVFVAMGKQAAKVKNQNAGDQSLESGDARNEDSTKFVSQSSGNRFLALVEQHKVKKGESLDSIAKASDLTWKQLARFNWGSDDPEEINEFLRRRVGCTKKTADGYNYIFDDTDDPGILDIPKPWVKSGLSTSQTHVIRVRQALPIYLVLENDEGMPIPEAAYNLIYESGESVTGTLGRAGIARINEPAEPTFEVEYPDEDDVLAKAIAGSLRRSFDERETGPAFWLFEHGQEMVERVIDAYDEYFNDYSGSGLIEDLYLEITDPQAVLILEALMTFNGIPARSGLTSARSQQQEDPAKAQPLKEEL